MNHEYQDLIAIFNDTFLETFNTKLELGGDEPIYLPADQEHPHHRIIFARGFYASALHEIAHWCVAGPERRLLEDFGYWYEPDGRTARFKLSLKKWKFALKRMSGFWRKVLTSLLTSVVTIYTAILNQIVLVLCTKCTMK